MQKKPYVSPQLTSHGAAVKMTAGTGGPALELINFRPPRP